MNPVEAVLFDIDDTICTYERSADDLLQIAFDRVGVDRLFDGRDYVERFDEFVDAGPTVDDARAAAFSRFAVEAGADADVGRAVARAYGEERDYSRVECRPGARRAIAALDSTYRLGVVTDGDPEKQAEKLRQLGLTDRFEVVVHGGHDAAPKPDPEPFEVALDTLGVDPGRAVHVGNSLGSDVRGARAAGVTSVWLRPEGGPSDPDPHPDHVVDSLDDLVGEPWN